MSLKKVGNQKSRNNTALWAYLISIAVLVVLYYFTLPVIQYGFTGLPLLIILFGVILMSVDLLLHIKEQKINKIGAALVIVGIVFVTIIPFITTSPLFHAKSYRNLLGSVKESNFTQDLDAIDVNEIRLVDQEIAANLGDKKLGEVPALGSQAKLADFHIQKVKGKLYWIAPLVHRNFWKWAGNRQGTLGYVMVSASNPQEVKLVQQINNKPVRIQYQPEAYFGQDLRRHIVFSGYPTLGTTDYTLEIDDKGNPFWIVTIFEKKVGYSGNDPVGVLVVDAQTGVIKKYSMKDAPKWIDRIVPEEMAVEQLTDWGLYVKGWWNSVIAEAGVLAPTPGMSLVYGKDHNSYWYTGITSSGADQSTIGFVLINTRTKESKFYKQPGATETAAMDSAEGKVQEKGYNATFPVMYNIMGVPTYVCSLKDKAGLVKMVAMISVQDFSILGIGETKQDALRAYRSALRDKGNTAAIDNKSNVKKMNGKVLRINSDVKQGNTYYYITIQGQENKIFIGTSKLSDTLPITVVGDTVAIQYESEMSSTIDISAFDNLNVPLK